MSLNPNANSWAPSATAAAFVPGGSWGGNAQSADANDGGWEDEVDDAPAPTTQAQGGWEDEDEPPSKAPVVEKPAVVDVAPPVEETPSPEVVSPAAQSDEKTSDPPTQASEQSTPADSPSPGTKKQKKKKKGKDLDFTKHDEREHLNIVFIGHVDAGKSTISGQILLQAGKIDERTIEKYEREAKDKNRESWWIAYIMDTSEEERAKGKTVECGRAHFDTEAKRYTILDAPGHKNYVPNMIAGATQADIGVLVISARKGEFEAGFNRGGQSREHAMLAYTLGITKLVIVVNKMDSVEWGKERYDEILGKLIPFLKGIGFKEKYISTVPISGLKGINIMTPMPDGVCPWFEGGSLISTLDGLKKMKRKLKASLRVPVLDKYKDEGKIKVIGKVESGVLKVGDNLAVMPDNNKCTVVGMQVDDVEVTCAQAGENVLIATKGLQPDQIRAGCVLCPLDDLCPRVNKFTAQIQVQDLLEHKPVMTSGYKAVLHIHNTAIEVEVDACLHKVHPKNGRWSKKAPPFMKSKDHGVVRLATEQFIACDTFQNVAQLGRFTLRDEGFTIAIGLVLACGDDKATAPTFVPKNKDDKDKKKKKKKKK